MTDDLDPIRLLASAALDNEATADERAQVAASEALTAQMEAYAGLRDEIAGVDVPASARESAIAAALGVFDAIQAGTDVATDVMATDVSVSPALVAPGLAPPEFAAATLATAPVPPTAPTAPTGPSTNVVSLHARRQRQYRWVGGIAAAAVVAVVGMAVINGSRSSDDKSSSAPRTESFNSTAKASGEAEASDQATEPAPAAAAPADSDSAADGATGGQVPPTTAAAAATTAGATETTEAAAEETASDAYDPWLGVQEFNTVDEVVAYALAPGSPVAAPSLASTGTSAETTAATTQEGTDTTDAADDTSAPVTTTTSPVPPLPESSYTVCPASGMQFAPIVFVGQRALLVRNDVIRQFEIIAADTCNVLTQFPIP